MADTVFTVDGESISISRMDVRARNFTFIVDEPPQLGGKDEGPTPVEYELGALAGCLNVLGHMIAGEMNFAIRSMRLRVEGRLDPMSFMGKAPGVRPGFKDIRAHFVLDTDASPDQLDAWIHAVEQRCPVSDNLSNTTPVAITAETGA